MDFKRPTPLEHPSDDLDARYSGPHDTAPTRPAEPVVAKKKGSKPMIAVLVLLLALCGGLAVYAYMDGQDVRSQLNASESKVTSLTSDNASLTNKLSDAKAEVATATKQPDDKTLITAVVKAKIKAPVASKNTNPTVNVMKQDSEFAYVNAGETGGFAAYILKKVDGTWTIVYTGQDKVSQATIATYGIPVEFQTGQ